MIPRTVLGYCGGIKGLAEVPIAAAQELIPSPELIGGIALETPATEIELKAIGPLTQQWCQQLAVGRRLYQEGGFGLGGELALNRDIAPGTKRRGLLNPAQQVSGAAHLVVAERSLVDEVKPLSHRRFGGLVITGVLFSR